MVGTQVNQVRQLSKSLTRPALGSVLLIAAAISVVGAVLLESFGLVSPDIRPLPFVGAILFIKLGFFTFWPVISRKGREASMAIQEAVFADHTDHTDHTETTEGGSRKPKQRTGLTLWDQNDPRLDASLFANNVPTFILNHEQRFLDWNAAFELVFGRLHGIKRGAHITAWFEHLDNFRRVPARTAKLYGEGILALADRERATFMSPKYGRMVFTKIMSPIIDRATGRMIGWTVVLNLNSVNKRHEFLEHLFAGIATETRKIRYAAAYDGVLSQDVGLNRLMDAHVKGIGEAQRVLEIGANTGLLTRKLSRSGRRITAVDQDVNLLRKLREKTEQHGSLNGRVRIVKLELDDLSRLPAARYDGVTMMNLPYRLDDFSGALAQAYKAMKQGGLITVSSILPTGGIDQWFNHVRTHLEKIGRFETLKHQFNHVLEHELHSAAHAPYHLLSREELRAKVLEAGFFIEEEQHGHLDGNGYLIVARKL